MTYISSDLIGRYQALHERAMGDGCIIYRVTETDDGEGGHTEAFAARDPDGVDCSFDALIGDELLRAQAIAPEATTRVKIPVGTVIEDKDRIVLSALHSGEFYDFEVKNIGDRSYPAAISVLVKEVGST